LHTAVKAFNTSNERRKLSRNVNAGMHEVTHTYQFGGMWKPNPMENTVDNYSESNRKQSWP